MTLQHTKSKQISSVRSASTNLIFNNGNYVEYSTIKNKVDSYAPYASYSVEVDFSFRNSNGVLLSTPKISSVFALSRAINDYSWLDSTTAPSLLIKEDKVIITVGMQLYQNSCNYRVIVLTYVFNSSGVIVGSPVIINESYTLTVSGFRSKSMYKIDLNSINNIVIIKWGFVGLLNNNIDVISHVMTYDSSLNYISKNAFNSATSIPYYASYENDIDTLNTYSITYEPLNYYIIPFGMQASSGTSTSKNFKAAAFLHYIDTRNGNIYTKTIIEVSTFNCYNRQSNCPTLSSISISKENNQLFFLAGMNDISNSLHKLIIHTLIFSPPLPTALPTIIPSFVPTFFPSNTPTIKPTTNPSFPPSIEPTMIPTNSPTSLPTMFPTLDPTVKPTTKPSFAPSIEPTMIPTNSPTSLPTMFPTLDPTVKPTTKPSFAPSIKPTMIPTNSPTSLPTILPTPDSTFTSTYESVGLTKAPSSIQTSIPSINTDLSQNPTKISTIIFSLNPTPTPTMLRTFNPSKHQHDDQIPNNEYFFLLLGLGLGLLSCFIAGILVGKYFVNHAVHPEQSGIQQNNNQGVIQNIMGGGVLVNVFNFPVGSHNQILSAEAFPVENPPSSENIEMLGIYDDKSINN